MAYIVVNDMVLMATAQSFTSANLEPLMEEVGFEFSGSANLSFPSRGTIRNYDSGQLYPPRER